MHLSFVPHLLVISRRAAVSSSLAMSLFSASLSPVIGIQLRLQQRRRGSRQSRGDFAVEMRTWNASD